MRHSAWAVVLLAGTLMGTGCSNGPSSSGGENPYTDAKNNFKSSDFKAALRNLDKTIKTTPDETTRQEAIVLRTALVTALADANKQMAEAYYAGAHEPASQGHTGPLFKMRGDYYAAAHGYLMDAMQSVMDQRAKLAATPVPIDVTFPGFMGTNPSMVKIKTGQSVSDSDGLTAEAQADRNALAMVLSQLAGVGSDPTKGEQAFTAGKVTVDPRVYLIELSGDFLQTGEMYEMRGGLNEPDKMNTVRTVVKGNLDAAQKLLDAKPDKDLEAKLKKVQAELEKSPTKKRA